MTTKKEHTMRVIDGTGDTKIIWDSDNREEVKAARNTFDDLRKKGFAAFSVKDDGKKNKRIFTFDPNAEKIILVPPMAGG